jgi:hypothetical protein
MSLLARSHGPLTIRAEDDAMNKATIDTDRSPLWLELVVLIATTLAATVNKYFALRTWVIRTDRPTVSDRTSPTYADRLRPLGEPGQ